MLTPNEPLFLVLVLCYIFFKAFNQINNRIVEVCVKASIRMVASAVAVYLGIYVASSLRQNWCLLQLIKSGFCLLTVKILLQTTWCTICKLNRYCYSDNFFGGHVFCFHRILQLWLSILQRRLIRIWRHYISVGRYKAHFN